MSAPKVTASRRMRRKPPGLSTATTTGYVITFWVFVADTGFIIVVIHALFVVAETIVLVIMALVFTVGTALDFALTTNNRVKLSIGSSLS